MIRALVFLRLVDPHDQTLSLTSIALIIVIVKLAMVKTPSVYDLGGLLLALANYNAKKWLAPDPAPAAAAGPPPAQPQPLMGALR